MSDDSSILVRQSRRRAATWTARSTSPSLDRSRSPPLLNSGAPGHPRRNRAASPPPSGTPRASGLASSGQGLRAPASSTAPLAMSRAAAAAAAAAIIAAREDPFLAQLHARLAGADHTLRESLGRRQALVSRFGRAGSSVGPTSEGDTSDFPSASVDASPDATGSSSSSPPDAAGRRED
ncbi:unnamed protein product, partial [Laminaria digitata]